jgi:SAM-dependent methyltransferase
MPMKLLLLLAIALASSSDVVAFVSPPPFSAAATTTRRTATNSDESATSSSSSSFVDPLTYLRTEWVSASLVSNQTPKEADRILQLGTEDGRLVNFVPRTVREIITSSAEKKDGPEGGGLTVSCERQLRQMAERRRSGATIVYSNQPADDLRETPSSSVDVVVSLLAARRMKDNGLDWRQAVREAGRVLKPGGRFLFVEGETIDGESYLDFVVGLSERGGVEIKGGLEKLAADEGGGDGGSDDDDDDEEEEEEERRSPLFEEVGYDMVDMVLQPHVAGVAIKAEDADLTPTEKERRKAQEESDRVADLSLSAFERGLKKRKRKKVQKVGGMGDVGLAKK